MTGLERILIVLDDKSDHRSKPKGWSRHLKVDLEFVLGLHRLGRLRSERRCGGRFLSSVPCWSRRASESIDLVVGSAGIHGSTFGP